MYKTVKVLKLRVLYWLTGHYTTNNSRGVSDSRGFPTGLSWTNTNVTLSSPRSAGGGPMFSRRVAGGASVRLCGWSTPRLFRGGSSTWEISADESKTVGESVLGT